METKSPGRLPKVEKQPILKRIKNGLALAAQLVITAPLKLPPKVVQAATYLSLLLSLLDQLDDDEQIEEGPADAP